MDPLLASLVLIVLALLGSRFSFSTERVPPGPRLLFRTGTHFLLVGLALGPSGLGLLTAEASQQLFPFLALGLGWVGFHFGLQLDRESLSHFPPAYYVVAFGQAVLTLLVVLGLGWGGIRLAGMEGETPLLLVLGAAAMASVTTPAGIAMVSSNFLVRGNLRDLLFFVASLDALVGIVALQLTYAFFRPEAVVAGLEPTWSLAPLGVAVGLGMVCGIVFLWLTRTRPAGEELVLFLLGICALAAGAALQWGLSPLFVSVVMGAVVANLTPDRARLFGVLEKWEKPVYLVFVLVAGALLQVPTGWVVLLALAYILARGAAKAVSGAVVAWSVPLEFSVPPTIGLGLVPQGGISIAMAVSGVLVYSGLEVAGVDAEASLFTIVVIGVMVSELVGYPLTVRLLRRAGEISPRVEKALAEGDERQAEREALRHSTAPERASPDEEASAEEDADANGKAGGS